MGTINAVLVGVTIWLAAGAPDGVRWIFEDSPVDKVPEGWSVAKTGDGPGSVWKVMEDESAPRGTHVLAQVSSEGPGSLFNLCVCDEANYAAVDLTVSFKAVKGEIDQGGGPVWRYQDENNYYIARMNPLEDNFRVYKVEGGRRKQLDSASVEASAGQWHSIRIKHKGDHIRCYLNGKLLLDVHDSTFVEAGSVGLWTKADAVTSFDDFSYRGN